MSTDYSSQQKKGSEIKYKVRPITEVKRRCITLLRSVSSDSSIILEPSVCENINKIYSIISAWINEEPDVEEILYLISFLLFFDKLPLAVINKSSKKVSSEEIKERIKSYQDIIDKIITLLDTSSFPIDFLSVLTKNRQNYLNRFVNIINSGICQNKLSNFYANLEDAICAISEFIKDNEGILPAYEQSYAEVVLEFPDLIKDCQKNLNNQESKSYDKLLKTLLKLDIIKNFLKKALFNDIIYEEFKYKSFEGYTVEDLFRILVILDAYIQKYCAIYALEKWGEDGLTKIQKRKYKREINKTLLFKIFKLKHLINLLHQYSANLHRINDQIRVPSKNHINYKNYFKTKETKKNKIKITIPDLEKYETYFNPLILAGIHYIINNIVIEPVPELLFSFFMNLDIQEGVKVLEGKKVHMFYVINKFSETLNRPNKKSWTTAILKNTNLEIPYYNSQKNYLKEQAKIIEKNRTKIQNDNVNFKDSIDYIFNLREDIKKLFNIKIKEHI